MVVNEEDLIFGRDKRVGMQLEDALMEIIELVFDEL